MPTPTETLQTAATHVLEYAVINSPAGTGIAIVLTNKSDIVVRASNLVEQSQKLLLADASEAVVVPTTPADLARYFIDQ